VRRLARELGVDLEALDGNCERIREEDVRAAAAEAGVRRVPLRAVRRAIAGQMLHALRTAASYTLVEEVEATELVAQRRRLLEAAAGAGVRLTYLPFLIGAVLAAMDEHPEVNAVVDEATDDLLVLSQRHLSLAVQTEQGLLAPVIRNAQTLGLFELAREITRLSEAARSQALTRGDSRGGTFTITSLGRLGGIMATPILNSPQVGILGVHRLEERPVVREGEVVIRPMLNLSLTMDHRYIDGWKAAEFMQTLKARIQAVGELPLVRAAGE